MKPARFHHDLIIDAASAVVAEQGPTGATISRIAKAAGAPTGSIYHRFSSRDVLLGEVWLSAAESFQSGFIDLLNANGTEPEIDDVALYSLRRVRAHPVEARVLLLHRREDFLDDKWPETLKMRAEKLGHQLLTARRNFCERIFGWTNAQTLAVASYALMGAPLAAAKPYIENNQKPPPFVDELILQTMRASFSLLEKQK